MGILAEFRCLISVPDIFNTSLFIHQQETGQPFVQDMQCAAAQPYWKCHVTCRKSVVTLLLSRTALMGDPSTQTRVWVFFFPCRTWKATFNEEKAVQKVDFLLLNLAQAMMQLPLLLHPCQVIQEGLESCFFMNIIGKGRRVVYSKTAFQLAQVQ